MLPVIAIVGRPNVGKSTLFNCLTKTRDALVADLPGLTRDRLYGQGKVGDRSYIVIDTGGLGGKEEDLSTVTEKQTQRAIFEADEILFVVDARAGLTSYDQEIAQMLRESGKPVQLVVNKVDGLDAQMVAAEFHALGLGEIMTIAAAHNRGVDELIAAVLRRLPVTEAVVQDESSAIRIAVVGKPNVGKSTLINRILGEERVVVSVKAGTTRDSIYIPFTRRDKKYILIDTAGMRRRGRVQEMVEKFSVTKTLQAIESANVVIFMLSAQDIVTDQDLHILGFILDAGKALVIAVNKWDNLPQDQRAEVKRSLDRRLVFVDFAKIKFISALHGTGVGDLFALVNQAYASATKKLHTSDVTKILEKAVADHQPPLVQGRRIRLRYAHVGGHNPPLIIVHGKQTRNLPESYRRYLAGVFRKALRLSGTPVRIEFRDSENPYVKKS